MVSKLEMRICKLCNHEWIPRILTEPKSCPRCKNYKWNENQEEE